MSFPGPQCTLSKAFVFCLYSKQLFFLLEAPFFYVKQLAKLHRETDQNINIILADELCNHQSGVRQLQRPTGRSSVYGSNTSKSPQYAK